jgi:hypothetical protein
LISASSNARITILMKRFLDMAACKIIYSPD